jgi:hypothetical protein
VTRAPARGGGRDGRLLDELREGFGVHSDGELAAWLGIHPSALSGVRTGRHGFGKAQRLKVLDRIGFLRTRQLVQSLVPERLAAEIVSWSHRNANAQARAALAKLADDDANTRLLDAAKIALEFDTDAQLADFLGVKSHTISMIRSGRSGLGDGPKLRILCAISGLDHAEIDRALTSPQHLITLVRQWRARADRE